MKKSFFKFQKDDLIFSVCFIVALFFMIWKSPFGFGANDEAFYLSLPYRLLKGDSLLYDDLHIAQLFSFFTYPVLKIYNLFIKTNEGIILNFRYIYVFFQSLSSFLIYLKIKKTNYIGAIISSLVFMLYTPFNLMALSYNTICLMTLTLSLIYYAFQDNSIDVFLSGLMFAAAVLCCPFLAISYFLFSAIVFYFFFRKKKSFLFDFEKWKLFTLGIIVLATLFIVFCLGRTTIHNIIKAIPLIIYDSSHPAKNLIEIIADYVRFTALFTHYSAICFLFYGMLLFVFLIDKKRKERTEIYFLFSVFVTILYLCHLFNVDGYINFLMYPIGCLGFFTILLIDGEYKTKFCFCYAAAELYCFYIVSSSNTGTYAVTSASSVATVISISSASYFIFSLQKKKDLWHKAAVLFTALLFCLMLIFEVYSRYKDVFSRVPISSQDRYIESGSYKGIFTDESDENMYFEASREVEEIRRSFDQRKALFLTKKICMYIIADDFNICAPFAWSEPKTDISEKVYILNNYYLINPSKQPDVIFVDTGFEDVAEKLSFIKDYKISYLADGKIVYTK